MSGHPPEGLRGRLGQLAGTSGLEEAERAVDALEVAVAENRVLEVPLERVVTELERAVADLVEQVDGGDVGT